MSKHGRKNEAHPYGVKKERKKVQSLFKRFSFYLCLPKQSVRLRYKYIAIFLSTNANCPLADSFNSETYGVINYGSGWKEGCRILVLGIWGGTFP